MSIEKPTALSSPVKVWTTIWTWKKKKKYKCSYWIVQYSLFMELCFYCHGMHRKTQTTPTLLLNFMQFLIVPHHYNFVIACGCIIIANDMLYTLSVFMGKHCHCSLNSVICWVFSSLNSGSAWRLTFPANRTFGLLYSWVRRGQIPIWSLNPPTPWREWPQIKFASAQESLNLGRG